MNVNQLEGGSDLHLTEDFLMGAGAAPPAARPVIVSFLLTATLLCSRQSNPRPPPPLWAIWG